MCLVIEVRLLMVNQDRMDLKERNEILGRVVSMTCIDGYRIWHWNNCRKMTLAAFCLQIQLKIWSKLANVTWQIVTPRSARKKNAVAVLLPSKNVLHISEKHYALVFIKPLYELEVVVLSSAESYIYISWTLHLHQLNPTFTSAETYIYICITCLVLGEQEQKIISNYDEHNPNLPFLEISASNKEIRIWWATTESP